MTKDQLELELLSAGNKYDGHVTVGSLEEQVKVVQKYREESFKILAGAIKKVCPLELIEEIKKHVDPVGTFIRELQCSENMDSDIQKT
jgi:hypothetical protein